MNIAAYIESGTLELYAMGALSESDCKEVEALLLTYPELQDELNKINNALEEAAMNEAVTPPASVKTKLLAQLDFAKPVEKPEAKVISLTPYKYAVAASITLFIISTTAALYYRNNWKNTERQLASATEQNSVLAGITDKVKYKATQMENEMAVLKNPDFKLCALKGAPNSPNALALVYWNQKSNEVYVSVKNMPLPAEGKQYQLWALVDGKPIDAGVFSTGNMADALQKVKNITNAQAFAVTLEKEGGSITPSLDQLTVIGNI